MNILSTEISYTTYRDFLGNDANHVHVSCLSEVECNGVTFTADWYFNLSLVGARVATLAFGTAYAGDDEAELSDLVLDTDERGDELAEWLTTKLYFEASEFAASISSNLPKGN